MRSIAQNQGCTRTQNTVYVSFPDSSCYDVSLKFPAILQDQKKHLTRASLNTSFCDERQPKQTVKETQSEDRYLSQAVSVQVVHLRIKEH